MSKGFSICEKCSRKTKSSILGKDGFLCRQCYNKDKTMLVDFNKWEPKISLEEALSKIYDIKARINSNNRLVVTHICCPQILIGQKVKLQLVEDSQKTSKEKK